MSQDLASDPLVVDERDQLQRSAAVGAHKGVDRPAALEQRRPRQAAGTPSNVGANGNADRIAAK
jgi:hypothetical protein